MGTNHQMWKITPHLRSPNSRINLLRSTIPPSGPFISSLNNHNHHTTAIPPQPSLYPSPPCNPKPSSKQYLHQQWRKDPKFKKKWGTIRLCAWNIAGLGGTLDELDELTNAIHLDYVFLAETWSQPHGSNPSGRFIVNHPHNIYNGTSRPKYGLALLKKHKKV